MIVTLQPIGRSEYALDVQSEPQSTSALGIGYERAHVACELNDEQRVHALGGRLRIHGQTGISWQGIVTRRPDLTEPLIARGWGWCATLGRRAIRYTGQTTTAVITDVITDEIPATYLTDSAAHRAWIGTESTSLNEIVFAATDAATKIAEVSKYVAWDFGWYMERVAGQPTCVPHWAARSTTPDYIVDIAECESHDIDESGLDELASAVWTTYDGGAFGTADTDTAHPLVALGITRYGDLTVSTDTLATAQAAAAQYLADNGRPQVKGSLTTRVLRSAYGVPVYLPDVRPGQMVRLYGLPDGQRDCVIKRITCDGQDLATVELDNTPYRLDTMLARIG
jgi:hypothetical protein